VVLALVGPLRAQDLEGLHCRVVVGGLRGRFFSVGEGDAVEVGAQRLQLGECEAQGGGGREVGQLQCHHSVVARSQVGKRAQLLPDAKRGAGGVSDGGKVARKNEGNELMRRWVTKYVGERGRKRSLAEHHSVLPKQNHLWQQKMKKIII
jgi:hypothetical protein